MKRLLRVIAGLTGALGASACVTPVGAGGIHVPKDSPARCTAYCQDLGMTLNAIVVMAGNVGCVCTPASGHDPKASTAGSSSAAAGMAAIELQRFGSVPPPPP